MNILLNLFPVRAGGGQQVASNFLKIITHNHYGHKWYCFVSEDSELHLLAKKLMPSHVILAHKYSYWSRIKPNKALNLFVEEHAIDMVYNYAPVLNIPKKMPQVVRSVYSNLYFPEINFWKDYPLLVRVKKKVIDYFRLKGTLKAKGLVFENESMLERSHTLFNYPLDSVLYIEPSVSSFEEDAISDKYTFLKGITDFKILYLSSWHRNKKITILPYVAARLKAQGLKVVFVLSLEDHHPEVKKELLPLIAMQGVESYFKFIGKVQAIHVHQVVKSCDALILLSKLECFSSNIIESFYFQKPLIISDEPWARAVCKDAVLYVDRENPECINSAIVSLLADENIKFSLIDKGIKRLDSFNTPENKVYKQVEFLEYIYRKYEKRN